MTKLFFLIGLCVTFNWLLIPVSGNSPRFTDLVGLVGLTALLIRLYQTRVTHLGLILIPVALVIPYWMFAGALGGDMSLAIFGLRLLLAATGFVFIAQLIVEQDRHVPFLWGMSVGAMMVGIIAMGQGTGWLPMMDIFIPPGTDTWWGGGSRVRAVGIWQHPNSVGQVQTVGAVAALSLAFMGPKIRPFAVLAFGVIVATTYLGTLNRTMILVCGLTMTATIMLSPHRTLKTSFIVVTGFLIALAPFFLAQVLGDRWVGGGQSPSIGENGAERLQTLGYSFEVMLARPFGHGINGATETLVEAFGFSATHNSFISLGLVIGIIPMAAMISLAVARLLYLRHSTRIRYEAPPMIALCCLFFFEDSIFLPSMISAFAIFVFWGCRIVTDHRRPVQTVEWRHENRQVAL